MSQKLQRAQQSKHSLFKKQALVWLASLQPICKCFSFITFPRLLFVAFNCLVVMELFGCSDFKLLLMSETSQNEIGRGSEKHERTEQEGYIFFDGRFLIIIKYVLQEWMWRCGHMSTHMRDFGPSTVTRSALAFLILRVLISIVFILDQGKNLICFSL